MILLCTHGDEMFLSSTNDDDIKNNNDNNNNRIEHARVRGRDRRRRTRRGENGQQRLR